MILNARKLDLLLNTACGISFSILAEGLHGIVLLNATTTFATTAATIIPVL